MLRPMFRPEGAEIRTRFAAETDAKPENETEKRRYRNVGDWRLCNGAVFTNPC